MAREIGRGGMGVVYLGVREDDQFTRQVAIKVLKRGMDTADILRRFEQERQLLAALRGYRRALDIMTTLADGDPDDAILQDGRADLLQVIDALKASIEEDLTAR